MSRKANGAQALKPLNLYPLATVGLPMTEVSYSEFRDNLAVYLDEVRRTGSAIQVTRQGGSWRRYHASGYF